jgi:YD repeat-containing protein
MVNYPTSPDITLVYNANSRLTSMSDGIGTTTYSYTAFGAVQTEDGPWADDTVSYTFTPNRLRAGLTAGQPTGGSWAVSYGYDSISRLTNVTSPAGAFGYQYHPGLKGEVISDPAPSPASLVRRLTLPGGVAITNHFDDVGRWLETNASDTGGTNLNQHLYEYNGVDQRITQTRKAGDFVQYGYDALGQLVKTRFEPDTVSIDTEYLRDAT